MVTAESGERLVERLTECPVLMVQFEEAGEHAPVNMPCGHCISKAGLRMVRRALHAAGNGHVVT